MNLAQQIYQKIALFPVSVQSEVLHFVEFMDTRQSIRQSTVMDTSDAQKMSHALEKLVKEGSLAKKIKNPMAWQKKQRQDRRHVTR